MKVGLIDCVEVTDQVKDMHVQSGVICKNCTHFRRVYWEHFTNGVFTFCIKYPVGRGREEDEYCNLWEKGDDAPAGV